MKVFFSPSKKTVAPMSQSCIELEGEIKVVFGISFFKRINHYFQHARLKIFPLKRKTNSVPRNLEGKQNIPRIFGGCEKKGDEKTPSFSFPLFHEILPVEENVACFSSATSSFKQKLVNFFEIQIECKMRESNGIFLLFCPSPHCLFFREFPFSMALLCFFKDHSREGNH